MIEEDRQIEFVRRAVAGDEDALQQLIVQHHSWLHASVRSRIPPQLRRHVDPDDVLQQAYVDAFRKISSCSFEKMAGFCAWLERIALDRLKKTERDLRRKKRDIGRQLDGVRPGAESYADWFERLPSADPTPSRSLARSEACAAVISSMARLTEEQRLVVRMRFLENRPIAEIAEDVGKSKDAVQMLAYRGLKSLRDLMGSITRFLTRA